MVKKNKKLPNTAKPSMTGQILGASEKMTRCTRCVLPETYPYIKFNQEGICNKCQTFRKQEVDFAKKEEELLHIFKRYKRNKKYDCIVPFSGGKDSSYVLYLVTKKYGLNPLAVNYNNHFKTRQAEENIPKVINNLKADFIQYEHSWELMQKLYRCFFLKTGHFCPPCDTGIRVAYARTAMKEHVPLIVKGNTPFDSIPETMYYYDQRYFKDVIRGESLPEEVRDLIMPEITRLRYRNLALPHYVDWNEDEIVEVLEREFGWEKADEAHVDHSDCEMSPICNYIMKRKFKVSRPEVKYSALIRFGKMSREDALQKIHLSEHNIDALLYSFLQKLDITREMFEQAVLQNHLAFKRYGRLQMRLIFLLEGRTKLKPKF